MDVNAILGGEFQSYITESQRTQAELESFKEALERAAARLAAGQEAELRKACEDFESYFLQIMFREMRKTSFDDGGFIKKSFAEKIFTDMMDEETSKSLAKSGGIGLADMLYRQMTAYGNFSS
ncbi:MAG: rod-binding protein [Defluviitaleaceae bacterium]|nr:rod-binding protein [Defluviitaleaceae bacterium]